MEVTSPTITIKVTGHQWYWSYNNDIVFEPDIFRRDSFNLVRNNDLPIFYNSSLCFERMPLLGLLGYIKPGFKPNSLLKREQSSISPLLSSDIPSV